MMHRLNVVVAVVVSLVVLGSDVAQAKKVALLVGVNKYTRRGFAEKPLQYAERDVDVLAVELRKHGFVVGVLKGSETGKRKATKENFETGLDLLLKDCESDDIVLLGFAGHGQQMPLRDEKARPLLSRGAAGLKVAMKLLGYRTGAPRRPSPPCDDAAISQIRSAAG